MGANIKYRMLGASGQANLVWADAADTTELAATACSIGSIGTIAGDPDKLYVYDGDTWNLIDKEGVASGVTYEGISPQTVLMVNKLLMPHLARLASVETSRDSAAASLSTLANKLAQKTLTNASGATGVTTSDAMYGSAVKNIVAGSVIAQTDAGTQTFAAPKAIVGVSEMSATFNPGNGIGGAAQNIQVDLATPLYGLSGTEDTIDFVTTHVVRKTKHITLDGTEAWTAGESEAAPYVLTLADKKAGTTNFACSHSIPAASGTTAGTCVGNAEDGTITFYPPEGTDYDTLTEWKAALAAQAAGDPEADPVIDPTPVQLVYELDDEVLDSGGTGGNFYIVDEATKFTHDAPGSISATYERDLSLALSAIESRLAELESA